MVIGHWHWWILIYETVNQATIIKKHHFLHWSRSKVQCWPGWRPSLGSLSVYISVLDPLVRVTTDTSYVSAPRLLCHGDTVSQSPLRDISCTPPALAHCNYCIVMVTHSSNIFSLNTGIWNNMLTVHWHSLQQYSSYFVNHFILIILDFKYNIKCNGHICKLCPDLTDIPLVTWNVLFSFRIKWSIVQIMCTFLCITFIQDLIHKYKHSFSAVCCTTLNSLSFVFRK